jgi:hypothetical protein
VVERWNANNNTNNSNKNNNNSNTDVNVNIKTPAPATPPAPSAVVLFLDVWTEMLEQGEDTWSSYLQSDGLHLSPEGNDFVAQQVMHLLDTHVVEVEALPSELPWGSGVDPEDYEASFRSHQAKYSAERIGLGTMFFPSQQLQQQKEEIHYLSTSAVSSHVFLVLIGVVFACIALFTFVNYFCSGGYFRANKDN